MATHSSILAWRIPWSEESGGLHIHACVLSHFSRVQLFVTLWMDFNCIMMHLSSEHEDSLVVASRLSS